MLDPQAARMRALRLGEEIENSFAVDRDAVYIVSDKRMYRFSAGPDGTPRVDWKVTYRNSGIVKPSQVDAGSGTTPTIMKGGYVAITDNADPMNVVVYRTARRLRRGRHRVVCQVPVFRRGASATENSLITAGHSLLVENNYGYQDPFGPTAGAITEPGFARVDVNPEAGAAARLDQHHRARAHRRPQALRPDRPDLHLHPGPRPARDPALVVDRDRLPHRSHGLEAARGHGRDLQQQLRGAGARARRHGVPGGAGRPRGAARRRLTQKEWPDERKARPAARSRIAAELLRPRTRVSLPGRRDTPDHRDRPPPRGRRVARLAQTARPAEWAIRRTTDGSGPGRPARIGAPAAIPVSRWT